jgi:photosystem II PsbJ protein
VYFFPVISLTKSKYYSITSGGLIMGDARIPLWIVGTIAGMGVLAVVALFFYGAYAGVGSSL